MTVGSFGYERLFGMGSTKIGDGTLLFAGEAGAYNGPWVNPDDMRKINGLLRYSQGTASDGLSITGMAYSNKWNSTDQVPQRAIASGQIGLYGEEDPTDGGNTDRFALSARVAGTDDAGSWKANAYVVKSDLDLFNDFTYFLTNPTQGDQFHQHDSRVMSGREARRERSMDVRRPADGNHVRRADPIRRHRPRSDRHLSAFLPVERPQRQGGRSECLPSTPRTPFTGPTGCGPPWAGAATTIAARVDSLFDANNSGNVECRDRQSQIHRGRGSVRQDRIFLRSRLRHAQQ